MSRSERVGSRPQIQRPRIAAKKSPVKSPRQKAASRDASPLEKQWLGQPIPHQFDWTPEAIIPKSLRAPSIQHLRAWAVKSQANLIPKWHSIISKYNPYKILGQHEVTPVRFGMSILQSFNWKDVVCPALISETSVYMYAVLSLLSLSLLWSSFVYCHDHYHCLYHC